MLQPHVIHLNFCGCNWSVICRSCSGDYLFFSLQYAVENEELTQHLSAAKDAQRQLTAEVSLKLLRKVWNTSLLNIILYSVKVPTTADHYQQSFR